MAQATSPQPTAPARPRLGEFLTREGIITQAQLLRALEEQKSFGGRLGRHLVELGYVTDGVLQEALARFLGIARIDLDAPGVVAADASRYARADLAEQWGFCPVEFDPKRSVLVIAMSDPDPQLIQDIEGFLAMKVEVRVATADAIERTSRRLFHGDGSPVKQMAGLQVARGERAANPADALGPPNSFNSPAPPKQAPVAYEVQLAQQLALQQQLQQYQLQQIQLQAQAVQPPAYPPAQYSPARPVPPQYPAAPPPQYPAAPPAQYQAAPPAQYPAAPPQQYPVAPPAEANSGAGFLPYSPASMASVEQLQEQVRKLEKTLATQARALRTLVELLVEKNMLSKAELVRKQQSYENK